MTTQQPIGACSLLLNSQGQVLMGKRKNAYKAGLYGMPGGRIELNELVLETIKREVLEETGLSVSDFTFVGIVRENQSEYDFIHFIYVANVGDREPQLMEPDKCEGWEWLDLEASHENILPGHKAGIELYLTGKTFADLTN
jgi:8-oxo-dGTP diphosphatase